MKLINYTLIGLSLLSCGVGSVRAESDFNEVEEYTFSELSSLSTNLDLTSSSLRGCVPAYERRIKKIKRNSIILPLVAVPATAATAAIGLEVGAIVTAGSESATSTILASSMGFTLGFYITPVIAVGLETLQVIKYFNMYRMIGLINEAEANPPRLDGPNTKRMRRRLESRGVLISAENLHAKVIARNNSGELCDGSLTNNEDSKKEKNKLVSFHKFVDILAHSGSQLKREDEKLVFNSTKSD